MTFPCIVADPPWPMPETGARTASKKVGQYEAKGGRIVKAEWWGTKTGKTVKLPYQTMTVEEIKSLTIPAAEDAHLYLWTMNRYVEAAYEVARAWGFRPSQLLTWCKTPMGIGFGGAYCNTTEFVLFCRKGKLKTLTRIDSTWWKWGRPYENGHIAHSAKPEAFIDMVESVSPGPYLELFARRNRLGWSTWGNESLCHIDFACPRSEDSTTAPLSTK
jgi:N6-adenosine-specific RNA methylase IME4